MTATSATTPVPVGVVSRLAAHTVPQRMATTGRVAVLVVIRLRRLLSRMDKADVFEVVEEKTRSALPIVA